ncbi:hypothetical protein RND81_01G217800 [Saponaria officinalis]|uniref:Selenoprotein K n=1 Tax=Saponaria officinalis TaxID=3572 RepID=A0AAW1NBQ1_SAPOF
MARVKRRVVKSKRSLWHLKTLTDFFWSIINVVVAFFETMYSEEKSDAYISSGSSKKCDGDSPGDGTGSFGGGPRGNLDHGKSPFATRTDFCR